MTQWFCQELLKTAFQHDTYTPPYTSLSVVLTRAVPAINTPPTSLDRPTGGAYADVVVPYNTANWTLTGFREVYNTNPISWPTITAYWGTLAGWAVVTSGGGTSQTVAVGRLASPQRGNTGITPVAAAGSLLFGIVD